MKLQEKADHFVERRKKKFFSERPFSEWRLPCMVLAVSGMVFILLTAMFGVTIDTRSGTVDFSLSPGDDWINPMIGKTGEDAYHVNPMEQYPWFCWIAMIFGYFIAVGLFIIGWFDYMKWKTILVERHEKEVKKND